MMKHIKIVFLLLDKTSIYDYSSDDEVYEIVKYFVNNHINVELEGSISSGVIIYVK